jgi:hypothetical protein
VRYGGPDAAPVTTGGPLPETSDLVAGWFMIDVDIRKRMGPPGFSSASTRDMLISERSPARGRQLDVILGIGR